MAQLSTISGPTHNLGHEPEDWFSPVRRWFGVGTNFLYPRVCPLCRVEIPRGLPDRSADFCRVCWETLAASQVPGCVRCGGTIGPHQDRESGCYYCRDEQFKFSRVIRVGVYRDDLGAACARMKGSGIRMAAALGRLTWDLCETEFRVEPIDGIVSIPRTWWQPLLQAHHAADTLAEVWGARLRAPVLTSILEKVRWTPQQTVLTPSDRRKNLRNAFEAEIPSRLRGKTLLLADDVMTTGATVQAATKALLQAGAGRVIIAVVARGLGQRGLVR